MRPLIAVAGVSSALFVLVAACAERVTEPGDSPSLVRRPRTVPLIAFARYGTRGRATSEIWVVSAGGTQTRLSNKQDDTPAWSPDGSKMAFITNRDGNTEIYVMNADGSGQTNLTRNAAFDGSPVWSPDGSKIAFASSREHTGLDQFRIYIMDANGGNQTALTTLDFGAEIRPAQSPDGSRIAFERFNTAQNDVYLMNADGSGLTNLTDNPASESWPAWKP